MKYKVGDKVRVKSLDWYKSHETSKLGYVDCGEMPFINTMVKFCNRIVTISKVNSKYGYYDIEDDDGVNGWTDEMIEGLAEEPTVFNGKEFLLKLANIELPSGTTTIWECPDGYIFKDENDNIINATKIILEKKKKEYPKTYEECIGKLPINWDSKVEGYKYDLLTTFQKLLICRDAYWKIAGDKMGLDKSWEPNWTDNNEVKFIIGVAENEIIKCYNGIAQYILAFPTEEMRDTFYENFKDLIEQCKELL